MHSAVAFAIVVSFFAIGEFVSSKTKALIPSILVYIILLLAFVWTGILPENVVELGGFTQPLVDMVIVVIVINMGSSLSISDLKKEWKTVVIGIGAIIGVAATTLTIGSMIFSWQEAVVVAPPISGGFVAAYEMSSRALAQNRQDLSNLALLVLALQSFPAFLIAPSLLKKEANRLLKPFREGKMSLSESEEKIKKRKIFQPIPEKYNSNTVILAKLGIVAIISVYASQLTGILFEALNVPFNITPTIFGLFLGVVFAELGLLESQALQKSNSYGYILIASIVGVVGNLASSEPAEIFSALPRILTLLVIAIVGILIVTVIVGRLVNKTWYMSFAIGLNCLLGFPPNYILSVEAISAVAENQEEHDFLMENITPSMLVGGFTTVTIGSVILASILSNFIFM